jgi:hypothetical protein
MYQIAVWRVLKSVFGEPQGTAAAKLNLPMRVNHEAMLVCRVVFVGVPEGVVIRWIDWFELRGTRFEADQSNAG